MEITPHFKKSPTGAALWTLIREHPPKAPEESLAIRAIDLYSALTNLDVCERNYHDMVMAIRTLHFHQNFETTLDKIPHDVPSIHLKAACAVLHRLGVI